MGAIVTKKVTVTNIDPKDPAETNSIHVITQNGIEGYYEKPGKGLNQRKKLKKLQKPDPIERVRQELDLEKTNTFESIASWTSQKAEIEKPSELAIVLIGLGLGHFLSALDRLIVATALPRIASDYHALSQISWVTTSYLLTTTAFQPTYGKISDIFGRKQTFLFAISNFLIGSLLCAIAPNMESMIAFRAFQGIGGGGIVSLVMIIISDIVPLRNRPNIQGLFGAVYGMASLIGPLVGGALTDHATWRMCFYLNLPIGALAIGAVFFLLRLPQREGSFIEKLNRIDWLGTSILVLATVSLLLPLSWGGDRYPWNHPIIISLLCSGTILFILFGVIEAHYPIEPISPIHLILNPAVLACYGVSMCHGMIFFSMIYYIPLYFQVVKGETATVSGLQLLPFVLAVGFGSIASCQLLVRTQRFKAQYCVIIGSAFMMLGAVLVSFLTENSTRVEQSFFLIASGLGVGFIMQTIFLVSVAAVDDDDVAILISLLNFFRSIGAIFGISIVGTVFRNGLTKRIVELGINLPIQSLKTSTTFVKSLDKNQHSLVIHAYVLSLQTAFRILIPFAGLCILCSLGLLRTKRVHKDVTLVNNTIT
ncbi:hypothetical protein G9A89_008098 [Geosiphon pyriformis]|nr:hypothetical protein G9A89_008098 [Geosiphon pyriformis]